MAQNDDVNDDPALEETNIEEYPQAASSDEIETDAPENQSDESIEDDVEQGEKLDNQDESDTINSEEENQEDIQENENTEIAQENNSQNDTEIEDDIVDEDFEEDDAEEQVKSGFDFQKYKKHIIIVLLLLLFLGLGLGAYLYFFSEASSENNATQAPKKEQFKLDEAKKPKDENTYKFQNEDINLERLNLKLALLTKHELVDDEAKVAEETYQKAMLKLKEEQLQKLQELKKIKKEENEKIEKELEAIKKEAKLQREEELEKLKLQQEKRAKELEVLKEKEEAEKMRLAKLKEETEKKLAQERAKIEAEQERKREEELKKLAQKKDDLVSKASSWLSGQMQDLMKEEAGKAAAPKAEPAIKAKEVVVDKNKKVTLLQVFTVRKLERSYVRKIATVYDSTVYACVDKQKRIRILIGPYESKAEFNNVAKQIRKLVASDAFPTKMRYGDLDECGKLRGKSSVTQ
jgi:chemotaxis protein histidine kinase CheA